MATLTATTQRLTYVLPFLAMWLAAWIVLKTDDVCQFVRQSVTDAFLGIISQQLAIHLDNEPTTFERGRPARGALEVEFQPDRSVCVDPAVSTGELDKSAEADCRGLLGGTGVGQGSDVDVMPRDKVKIKVAHGVRYVVHMPRMILNETEPFQNLSNDTGCISIIEKLPCTHGGGLAGIFSTGQFIPYSVIFRLFWY